MYGPLKKLTPVLLSLLLMNQADPSAYVDHPDIYLRRAFSQSLNGNVAGALTSYKKFFESGGEPTAYAHSAYARTLYQAGKKLEAEEEAREAVSIRPNDPDYISLYARILRQNKKYDEAQKLLARAIPDIPDNLELEFAMAETLYMQGRMNEATVHYRQVLFLLENGSASNQAYYSISLWKLAVIHLDTDEPDAALTYLLRYTQANPERLYPRFILGFHIYFQQGRFEKAARQFKYILQAGEKEALAQEVDLHTVYASMGQIHFLEDRVEALPYLRRALHFRQDNVLIPILIDTILENDRKALVNLVEYVKKSPGNIFARYGILKILARSKAPESVELYYTELINVSRLISDLNRHRQGLSLLRRALVIRRDNEALKQPGLSYIYEKIAGLYESMNEPNRAIVYTEKAIDYAIKEKRFSSPQDLFMMRLALARLLSDKTVGKEDRALAICDEVISIDNKLETAYFVRGLIHLQYENYTEAVADFNRAIELQNSNFQYYFYRAVAFDALDKFKETETDLKRVLELQNDFPEASNFLGYKYAEMGIHMEEAMGLIKKAIESSPMNGAYQDSLGWVYFQNGNYERARYHLKLAALILEEEGKEDPVVYDHLGDVYLKLKAPYRAMEFYRKAVRLLKERSHPSSLSGDLTLYEIRDNDLRIAITKKIDSLLEESTSVGN